MGTSKERYLDNQFSRVVITGIGPVTPAGIGKEALWENLAAGRSFFKAIDFPGRDMSQYRSRIAAPIEGFDLLQYVPKNKYSKYLGKTSQFAVVGALLALRDAGIGIRLRGEGQDGHGEGGGLFQVEGIDPFEVGVILGMGVEAMDLMEHYHQRFLDRGPRGISPFALPNIYLGSITSHVSQFFTLRGASFAVSTACASATHAMINSFLRIRGGGEKVMVTGGADACVTPYVFAGFDVMRAMSTRNEEPQKACRPFDRDRDGFVMGEGAGVVVLEELEHARNRGAHLYAEITGFGMTSDAYHLTEPDPEGTALARAVEDALASSGCSPGEVDYINPHGTSTPYNDRVETRVIKRVFGEQAHAIPISSTKAITGHLMGASGGAETAAVLLAMERGIIHPTLNYDHPDPECDLDYVPNRARESVVRTALSMSAGFGGVNSALLFRKMED